MSQENECESLKVELTCVVVRDNQQTLFLVAKYSKWHFSVSLSYASEHFRATERNRARPPPVGVEDEVQGFCNCSHRLTAVVSGNDFFLKSGNNSNSRKIMALCLALILPDLDLENSQKFILELTLSIFIIDINKTFQISIVQQYFTLTILRDRFCS